MTILLDQVFSASTRSLSEVRLLVRSLSAEAGCSEACVGDLVLAVNEACMNIIQHGYSFADGQQFRIRMLTEDGFVRIHLLDQGIKANLGLLQPRALDEVRPGGLGVHFMREVTDDIVYLAPPDGYNNMLQLSKCIQ